MMSSEYGTEKMVKGFQGRREEEGQKGQRNFRLDKLWTDIKSKGKKQLN